MSEEEEVICKPNRAALKFPDAYPFKELKRKKIFIEIHKTKITPLMTFLRSLIIFTINTYFNFFSQFLKTRFN